MASSWTKMHIKDFFTKVCIVSTVGVLITGFGTIFAIFWLEFFESLVAKEMKLGANTKSYEIWKNPPIPMSLDLYFYNWTNPTNFTADEFQKPILKELGPYRFTEITDKTQIKWHPKNQTVSFRKKSTFFFDAAGSNGSLDDVITSLNIVALSAAAKALHWPFIKQKSVSIGLTLYHQLPYIVKTARELMFEGYQDDLIDMAREVPFFDDENMTIPYDRFGWFYMRNGTDNQTGHYNMHTGDGDISQIGSVKLWDYTPKTPYFPNECGMVNGSAGEFYAPNQQRNVPISFFSSDMCRTIKFDYTEDVKIHGITGYKYSGGKKLLDNGTEYPENLCFSGGDRVPSGVMNVSSCRFGTPVFMSFPHYYQADPYYLNQVDGLKPEKEKHEFYMALEPKTGIALDVAARFQINMLIRPVPNVAMYQEAPLMFFPVLWFEQKVQIPADLAIDVQTVLSIPSTGYIIIGIIILIGLVVMFWMPVDRCMKNRKKNNLPSTVSVANIEKSGGGSSVTEKVIPPEDSPLLINKNGVAKIEFLKMNQSDDIKIKTTPLTRKLAPLAEKEVENLCDKNC